MIHKNIDKNLAGDWDETLNHIIYCEKEVKQNVQLWHKYKEKARRAFDKTSQEKSLDFAYNTYPIMKEGYLL